MARTPTQRELVTDFTSFGNLAGVPDSKELIPHKTKAQFSLGEVRIDCQNAESPQLKLYFDCMTEPFTELGVGKVLFMSPAVKQVKQGPRAGQEYTDLGISQGFLVKVLCAILDNRADVDAFLDGIQATDVESYLSELKTRLESLMGFPFDATVVVNETGKGVEYNEFSAFVSKVKLAGRAAA